MFAVIETGGKQYTVAEGDVINVEKLGLDGEVKFDKVLAVHDGKSLNVGTPTVEGASVSAKVVCEGKGKKIDIFKYKPKTGYRKRQGHRQPYTMVEILKIKTAKAK